MKVILIDDVDTLGEKGEIHDVSDGFYRNYLSPQGYAIQATPGALQDLERRIERIRAQAEKKHAVDLEKAKKVEGMGQLTLEVRAGEHGKLFGVVTTKELARLISEKTELTIDRKSVKVSKPINRLGEYEVHIRISPKVMAKLPIQVTPDEESAKAIEEAGGLQLEEAPPKKASKKQEDKPAEDSEATAEEKPKKTKKSKKKDDETQEDPEASAEEESPKEEDSAE